MPKPTSPSSGPPDSGADFRTRTTRARPLRLDGRLSVGNGGSPSGTRAMSPTDPPKRSTTDQRMKQAAFGFTRFRNYHIRSLLYAGMPNWDLLATVTPR